MQWQRTGRCLQARSVGECLKRHSEQQLTDQTMYVFIFWPWFSSLALAQLVLAALVVSESTFNACKTLCLRLAFMKYTRSMDCPKQSFKFPWVSWHPKSYKDVSLLCAQEGEEWYSIWSSILCHRRIASARHVLSSLCLLHDTTGTELSFVPFYQWRIFTDSVTEATATWNPMFKT